MRLPRQIGYKNKKFITHLTVTDNLRRFGKVSAAWLPSTATPGTPAELSVSRCIGSTRSFAL
jgi:hypothetical protein